MAQIRKFKDANAYFMEVERLKTEDAHAGRIIRHVIMGLGIFTAIMLFAITRGVNFAAGIMTILFLFVLVGFGIIFLSKRSDDIIKKEIPGLIIEYQKLKKR